MVYHLAGPLTISSQPIKWAPTHRLGIAVAGGHGEAGVQVKWFIMRVEQIGEYKYNI